jgi:hypothetical protein
MIVIKPWFLKRCLGRQLVAAILGLSLAMKVKLCAFLPLEVGVKGQHHILLSSL